MCPVTTTLFQPAGEGGKAVRTAGGGRQAKYHTADDKAAAQRHNAILHYHRKRALQKRIKEILENEGPDGIQNGDTIDVHINIFSKGLGDYSEDIYYRVIDKDRGAYQLQHTQFTSPRRNELV